MTFIAPASSSAATTALLGVEQQNDVQEINVSITQTTLLVTGASGYTLEIISLTGKQVMKTRIEAPAQRIELNIPKGCYIVKIGGVVRKISVR